MTVITEHLSSDPVPMTAVIGVVCVAGAFASLRGMRESYDAELDWLER